MMTMFPLLPVAVTIGRLADVLSVKRIRSSHFRHYLYHRYICIYTTILTLKFGDIPQMYSSTRVKMTLSELRLFPFFRFKKRARDSFHPIAS